MSCNARQARGDEESRPVIDWRRRMQHAASSMQQARDEEPRSRHRLAAHHAPRRLDVCQRLAGLTPATSAPGLVSPAHICAGSSPLPRLHRDWAHPCPHLHRDWAHPPTSAPGPQLAPATSAPGLGCSDSVYGCRDDPRHHTLRRGEDEGVGALPRALGRTCTRAHTRTRQTGVVPASGRA